MARLLVIFILWQSSGLTTIVCFVTLGCFSRFNKLRYTDHLNPKLRAAKKNSCSFFAFFAPNLHTCTHYVRKSYLIQHTASFRFSAFSSIVVSRSMLIWWLRFLSAIKVSSLRLLQIKERLKAVFNIFLDVTRYYPFTPFR
jgi:hypothetical protein